MRILLSIIFLCLPAVSPAESILLEIRHLWQGEELKIPGDKIRTAAGEEIEVSRLAYLLSEPSLEISESKRRIGRKDWFGYIDASTPVSKLTLAGVPAGSYSNLVLHIGLNTETDRADPNQYPANHPLNPLVNNLHWTPQGGYIFLALEGYAEPIAFSWHLGNPRNRVTCRIPVKLDHTANTTIALDFHLDRLFNTSPPLVTREQTSTHSREGDPLAAKLKLGLKKVFSVRTISSTSNVTDSESIDKTTRNLVGTPYQFRLKKGFPIPHLPTDYPLTNERVALGTRLFNDPLLSRTGKISCASCHHTDKAFTDGLRFSEGVENAPAPAIPCHC